MVVSGLTKASPRDSSSFLSSFDIASAHLNTILTSMFEPHSHIESTVESNSALGPRSRCEDSAHQVRLGANTRSIVRHSAP
jgi:hypothetical protein